MVVLTAKKQKCKPPAKAAVQTVTAGGVLGASAPAAPVAELQPHRGPRTPAAGTHPMPAEPSAPKGASRCPPTFSGSGGQTKRAPRLAAAGGPVPSRGLAALPDRYTGKIASRLVAPHRPGCSLLSPAPRGPAGGCGHPRVGAELSPAWALAHRSAFRAHAGAAEAELGGAPGQGTLVATGLLQPRRRQPPPITVAPAAAAGLPLPLAAAAPGAAARRRARSSPGLPSLSGGQDRAPGSSSPPGRAGSGPGLPSWECRIGPRAPSPQRGSAERALPPEVGAGPRRRRGDPPVAVAGGERGCPRGWAMCRCPRRGGGGEGVPERCAGVGYGRSGVAGTGTPRPSRAAVLSGGRSPRQRRVPGRGQGGAAGAAVSPGAGEGRGGPRCSAGGGGDGAAQRGEVSAGGGERGGDTVPREGTRS